MVNQVNKGLVSCDRYNTICSIIQARMEILSLESDIIHRHQQCQGLYLVRRKGQVIATYGNMTSLDTNLIGMGNGKWTCTQALKSQVCIQSRQKGLVYLHIATIASKDLFHLSLI